MNEHLNSRVNCIVALSWLLACSNTVSAQTIDRVKHPYASEKPLSDPVLFGEGIISTGEFDSHPAFTPDGRTLYFLRNTPNFSWWTILVSSFENGKWRTPEVAPFSGRYSDADPLVTSDGSRLYFISNRPVTGKATPDLDIWVMDLDGTGWGEPKNLGAPINSTGREWYPTIAANGTMYFGSDRDGGKGRTDIYRSRLMNGKYSEAENLGDAINTPFDEFEPLIASDESYVIFMSGGRPDSRGGFDLYISHNHNGVWTEPANLGEKINSGGDEYSPRISPDGKYFFWTSTRELPGKSRDKRLDFHELMNKLQSPRNGLGDIYQIDIDKVLSIRN